MLPDGEDAYELEIPYEDMGNRTDTAESLGRIKRSLRAGIIPEEYQGIIESAEIAEKKVFVKERIGEACINPYGSEGEMKGRATEGYFVRDPERNLV